MAARRHSRHVTGADVIEVLDSLEAVGVHAWVDGGWGVDALVRDGTREHADLDLALDAEQLDVARRALEELGLRHDETIQPGPRARLAMRDGRGREVDLHPLTFDGAGRRLAAVVRERDGVGALSRRGHESDGRDPRAARSLSQPPAATSLPPWLRVDRARRPRRPTARQALRRPGASSASKLERDRASIALRDARPCPRHHAARSVEHG